MWIIPAFLDNFRTLKDKSIKLTFETSELTPDQIQGLASSLQFPGYLAFNKDAFTKELKEAIENIKTDYDDQGKTKGQRLRAVLYRNFEQNPEGYKIFDDYYNYHMEKIIIHFKNKLD
jgi:predicted Zn-dependent peptidase